MHMKIVSRDGKYILGQFSQPFDSIPLMIHHYSISKLPIKGAEHMSLLHPVINELLWWLLSLEHVISSFNKKNCAIVTLNFILCTIFSPIETSALRIGIQQVWSEIRQHNLRPIKYFTDHFVSQSELSLLPAQVELSVQWKLWCSAKTSVNFVLF